MAANRRVCTNCAYRGVSPPATIDPTLTRFATLRRGLIAKGPDYTGIPLAALLFSFTETWPLQPRYKDPRGWWQLPLGVSASTTRAVVVLRYRPLPGVCTAKGRDPRTACFGIQEPNGSAEAQQTKIWGGQFLLWCFCLWREKKKVEDAVGGGGWMHCKLQHCTALYGGVFQGIIPVQITAL